jgi:hypothetical protein
MLCMVYELAPTYLLPDSATVLQRTGGGVSRPALGFEKPVSGAPC